MSSKNERERKAFHRRQMDALPTLISGLDPDPPVLLCPHTERFDGLVCQALRAAGWPSSGKSPERRKADPPAPIKGAVLARKLAKGNALTGNEVTLLAERIAWLQRNWFRWPVRDGYHVLATGEVQERAEPSQTNDVGPTPPEKIIEAERRPKRSSETERGGDLFSDTAAQVNEGSKEALTQEMDGTSSSNPAARNSGNDCDGTTSGGFADSSSRPAGASQNGDALRKCDAALASLARLSDSEDVPSFDDYVKGVGEGGSGDAGDRLISLRTKLIKSVDGDKVRSFLFAIYYDEPREEIERRARALASERTQLLGALSREDSTSEDIREAFGKLGLDADV